MRSWLIVTAVLAACGGKETPPAPAKDSAAPAESARRNLLLVGTSLTAGYGLDSEEAWPALLQRSIDSAGLPFHVVNAGVSGEVSASTLRRVDWLLSQQAVELVVMETGANDGLRGQSIDSLAANLDAILAKVAARVPRPVIVVAGMEALPNMGRDYVERFRALFPRAAAAHGAVYLPFLLDGVAGVDSLNQADGIHPNVRGSRIVVTNVWKVLRPILDSLRNKS